MLSRHVVVVENEPLMRDLIGKTLEASGFRVTTAANAADAKRVHKAVDPDAVVIDIELGPGPDVGPGSGGRRWPIARPARPCVP